jgi:hypothetical protein
MLLTIYLSQTETLAYAAMRGALRAEARCRAVLRGRRFAQIVGSDGRILDVIEA